MEESVSSKELTKISVSNFNTLSSDIIEFILSILPITSIVRATAVCKLWHSILTTPTFFSAVSAAKKKPFFFLCFQENISSKIIHFFAFDPESNHWLKLPVLQESYISSFCGCNGFYFSITSRRFRFSPILSGIMHETCLLKFPRQNPLVCVLYKDSKMPRFIVVGGVKFIGEVIGIEDSLAVEIYNPHFDSWQICPSLPADFRAISCQSLSFALFSDDKFYIFNMYSCLVCMFDLNKNVWSGVQTLRPPGVMFAFLISCNDQLVLAGLCYNNLEGMSFNLWRIDEKTMEFSELAIMPYELLCSLVDPDDEYDEKFDSLKCVGLDNLVYVFNEEHKMNYPACVCEISSEFGQCSWRRIPDLPVTFKQFHRVESFCSNVSLDNIVRGSKAMG